MSEPRRDLASWVDLGVVQVAISIFGAWLSVEEMNEEQYLSDSLP